MRRFVVLVTIGAAFAALGAVACGDGNKPPPLTPDSEHPLDGAEAGAPSSPATPSTAAPPANLARRFARSAVQPVRLALRARVSSASCSSLAGGQNEPAADNIAPGGATLKRGSEPTMFAMLLLAADV